MLLDTLEQVVVVPTSAVQRGPEGTFVYVVGADNKASTRPISVGQQDETLAVITKGVAPSDVVVTTGFARLKDGAEVIVSPPGQSQKPAADAGTPQASAGDDASRRHGLDQRRDAGKHARRPAPRVPPRQARRRSARAAKGSS